MSQEPDLLLISQWVKPKPQPKVSITYLMGYNIPGEIHISQSSGKGSCRGEEAVAQKPPYQYSHVYTTGQEQVLGSTVLVSAIQSLQSSAENTGEEIPRGARSTAWAPRTYTTTLTAPRAQQGGGTDKTGCQLPVFWQKPQRSHPPGLVTHGAKPKPCVPAHSQLHPVWSLLALSSAG